MSLDTLNKKIEELYIENDKRHSLDIAIEVSNEVIKILKPSAEGFLYGEDALDQAIPVNKFPNHKVENWFENHPYFKGDRVALRFYEDELVETRFYWLSESSTKAHVAGGVMLTENWEDSVLNRNDEYKLGLDFFLTSDAKSLLVVISNLGNLRVLELHKSLTHTQREILSNITNVLDLKSKEQSHKILWDALALSEVNLKFYAGIAEQFNILLNHLIADGRDKEDAKLFTSRLIGRLLFVWFLRRKNIISEKYNYFEVKNNDSTQYYESKLKKLFFETLNAPKEERVTEDKVTPYLNGGLFKKHPNDWVEEKVSFPRGYFNGLYEHLNKYNFTTDESSPEYEQVAIDPEMLGRVFESLLATQVTETGEQARKAKGAFYTPREIVSYMCKESLRQYLYTKLNNATWNEGVNKLLDVSDSEWEINHSNSKRNLWGESNLNIVPPKVITALDELKVLDPACGSGAFPMGMLQLILKVYERLDIRFDRYKTKLQIVQKNIFGIDVEPMAIEISRLRTWLSLVVDQDLSIDDVKPLPSLDFKFVCANSLIPLTDGITLGISYIEYFDKYESKASTLMDEYYNPNTPHKRKGEIEEEYKKIINAYKDLDINGKEEILYKLDTYNPFESEKIASFFDSKLMFGIEKQGFDIVIGNPPYVSTKGVSTVSKTDLVKYFRFADDLYSHFYFKGFELLKKDRGILSFITSKTFWTIQTKKNLRELLQRKHLLEIYDSASPFSAMVETCIVTVSNEEKSDYILTFKDGTEDLFNPQEYEVSIEIYRKAVNKVFFVPTDYNIEIYEKYNKTIKDLMLNWWFRIESSEKIRKNLSLLESYRNNLKPGDITLLGLLTDGGQGLATANNGYFVGVKEGTKWAKKIVDSRPKKLFEAIKKKRIKELENIKTVSDAKIFLQNKSEVEIREIFDKLKEKYERDLFGKGYLYKIIKENEIADVDNLSSEQKLSGISDDKPHYVPYDKGDKDGNRWYLETPFYIDWSKTSVKFLKSNSGKKGKGMPVVRNQEFYFKEGFCWTDVNTVFLKARLKNQGVHDVLSMSLTNCVDNFSDKYYITLINSDFIAKFVSAFINTTSHFQINDARQIPIIIPTESELKFYEDIFNRAYRTKIDYFNGKIGEAEQEEMLSEIQDELDKEVYRMYGIEKPSQKTS